MTKQELLQAVYARLGGKPDSAPEPLILAKAKEAIKAVTKELVYSGHPMAVELVKQFTVTSHITKDESNKFFLLELSNSIYPLVKTGSKLLSLTRTGVDDAGDKMDNTNSWDALETLPSIHNHPYYKWSNNKLYIRVPDSPQPANVSFKIEHYAYLPLSEFPYELVDILLTALIPMLALPAEQPEQENKNAKQKK